MWKPNKQCTPCTIILSGDIELKKRIYHSTRFLPDEGAESLADIQRSYGSLFSYQSLVNHCKKHQTLDAGQRARMRIDPIIKQEPVPTPALPVANTPDDVFGEVINQGMEALQNQTVKLSARDILGAAKMKADLELKRKDQNIKMQEMIWHFTSGEASNATAYDRRIIEGETATAYDAADVTARNIDTIAD